MSIKLHLFGPPRLVIDGKTSLLNGTNTAVLSLLALSKATQFQLTRSRLAGTIWPESEEEHARQLLSNALYRLKRLFGQHIHHLVIDHDTIALHDIWIDVWAFHQHSLSNDVKAWQAAIQLYSGDLLEGHDGIWALAQRAAQHEHYLRLLSQTTAQYEAMGELEQALLVANQWTLADPLNETAHSCAMQLYVRLGRYGIALQQYEKLKQLLAQELGVTPLPETEALYALIQHERQQTEAIQHQQFEVPFVGRQIERQQLIGCLERLANGKGGVVLLEGAPGMGKTRLLREISKSAEWRGFCVAWGELAEHEGREQYDPLPALLRALLLPAWLDQIIPKLSNSVQKLLSHWLPYLRKQLSDQVMPQASSQFRPTPVQLAISKALSLMGDLTPSVLILDDLQWGEAGLWEVLPTLVRLSEERPFLFVLSYRSQEIRTNANGWQAVQTIDKAHQPLHIILEGLRQVDCQAMAQQLGKAYTAEGINNLYELSNGNPLFLKEAIINEQLTPRSFEQTIAERVALLSETAVQALSVASVLGREFPFGVWQLCVNEAIPLTELLNSRFLHTTKQGVAFDHDLVRAHIYDSLSPTLKRQWHGNVAQALPVQNATLGQIGWHYEQAQDWENALYFYQRAADFAYQIEDNQVAEQYCERALRLTAVTPPDPQTVLQLKLRQLQLIPTVMLTAEDDQRILAVEQETAVYDDPDIQLKTALIKIKYLLKHGKIDELESVIDQAVLHAANVPNRIEEINALTLLAKEMTDSVRNTDKGLTIANRAIQLSTPIAAHPHLLVKSIFVRTLAHLHLRAMEDVYDDLQWAEQLINEHPELAPLRTEIVFYQAIAAQMNGAWEEASVKQHQLITLYKNNQQTNELLGALYNGCNVAMFTCQFEEAVMLAEDLLETAETHIAETEYYYLNQYRAMAIEAYSASKLFTQANELADKLLAWAETEGAGVAQSRALSAIAVLRIDEKSYEAAYQLAHQILALDKYEASLTTRSYLLLAECAFLTGRHEEGVSALAKANEKRKPGLISSSSVYYFYVSFLAEQSVAPLSRAYDIMLNIAKTFNSLPIRLDYLMRSPFHEDLFAAMHRFPFHFKEVALSTTAVSDPIRFFWTIDNGAQDAQLLAEQGKVALRHHRLQRLVQEAAVYGTVPTHADLADALGVTVRTIERDSHLLSQQGVPLITRGVAKQK